MVTFYPMLSTAPQPSLIYRPGIRTLAPGLSAILCAEQARRLLLVKAGDGVVLTDIEGGQACEIAFCDDAGRFDASALGARATSHGEGLKALLAEDSENTQRTKSALQRRNIDLGKAETVRLFGEDSRAGASAEFKVSRDGVLIVAAPGAAMAPENQDTATDIELRITRSGKAAERGSVLPEPLADPLQDFRIRAVHRFGLCGEGR